MLKKLLQHRLFKNSSALFLAQLFTYAAPLLVLPYLSRILGVDGFGLVIAGTSLIVFSNIITDFGFDLSATYLISRKKNSKQYISSVITTIYKLKTLILLIAILPGLTFYLLKYESYNNIALVAIYLSIIFQAYQAIWLFQGIEKMKLITYIMISSKVFYILLIFILVKNENDYGLALLSHAISVIVATLIANYLIRKEKFHFTAKSSKRFMKLVFHHSSQFFLSRVATTTTASVSTLLVHNFTSPFQTGLYGASERLLTAFRGITAPLNQALYPYMANTKNIRLLFKIISIIMLIVLLPFIMCVYFAPEILAIIFGDEYRPATPILRIFLFTGFFALITMFLGYPAFAAIDKIKYANISVIIGGSIQILLLAIMLFTNTLSAINIAWSILIIELIVLTLRAFWLIKNIYLNKQERLISSNSQ